MSATEETGNGKMSYWIATAPPTSLPPLQADEEADVAVIGGGIAGLTTAYLLARSGRSVVLLERDHVAMAETGHTTAHLQVVVDTPLSVLVERLGLAQARLAWDSQWEAVRTIEGIVRDERISCGLERVDAFLWSRGGEGRADLSTQLRLARKLGYEAGWAQPGAVPFRAAGALRFPDQGKFHVRRYMLGLLDAARKAGARVFEHTEVSAVDGGEVATLRTRGGPVVRARHVVHATNAPFGGSELLHAAMRAYRTYAIAARVPRGVFPDALFWDTEEPYHYTRVEPGYDHDVVIHGGEDHPVGASEASPHAWDALERDLREVTREVEVIHRWSGEVLETDDDLPYIGRLPGRGDNEFVITGDSGTGMTNGTIGALMVAEQVAGRGTPWDDLYDAGRAVGLGREVGERIKGALHDAAHVVKRPFMRGEIEDVAQLAPGEGALVRRGLRMLAVARLPDGQVCALDATCTHAGCLVRWNAAESSWDCACHGSRFAATGEVLHGPANEPLADAKADGLADEPRGAKR